MNLIIGNQPVALHEDSTLSLERLSPALNDKVGSFSYPFPVPTSPNQRILGWPGVLERTGEIASKSFILEEQGIQILRGEIEYDTITREQIGIILTSGLTEFYTKLEELKDQGSTLANLDLGSETWFSDEPTTWELWMDKLSSWSTQNRTAKAPIVLAPFQFLSPNGTITLGNKHNDLGYLSQPYADNGTGFLYMLQFKAWYILEKIFTFLGYQIVTNQLKDGNWEPLTILSRPFLVTVVETDAESYPDYPASTLFVHPPVDTLNYARFMPTVSAYDFIEEMRVLMGLSFDVNDLKKEVNILFLKNVLTPSDSVSELHELSGWQHKEVAPTTNSGYSLSFMSQDDPLDNRADYVVNTTFPTNAQKPATPSSEGYVIHITSTNTDYIAVKNSSNQLVWERIGRLKPVTSGYAKNSLEFGVKVAAANSDRSTLFKGPKISLPFSYLEYLIVMYDMPEIYVSIYWGMTTTSAGADIPLQTVPIPFLCSDQWNPIQPLHLSPKGIYDTVYKEYLDWKTSSPRSFSKIVLMTLPELLSLQWDSRYVISGVKVVLSQINYDLPFKGIVKLQGYVG